MIRLAEWLRRRASSRRTEASVLGSGHTVRTVETVECHERTFLIGRQQIGDFETCPLCGSKLGSPADVAVRPQLHE
jgi:hypothetical protein